MANVYNTWITDDIMVMGEWRQNSTAERKNSAYLKSPTENYAVLQESCDYVNIWIKLGIMRIYEDIL